ncbi:TPA: hypothetical protein ACSQRH_000381 [Clostridium perfringens]
MFLDVLNKEDKANFLEFVNLIAKCDGEFAEEEKEILNNYMVETGINEIPDNNKNIEDIVEYFSKRDEAVRKIILFEAYGLVLADNKITDEEKEIIMELDKMSGLNKEKLNEVKEVVIRLQKVYDDIYNLIF